jgi:hypothetical protein
MVAFLQNPSRIFVRALALNKLGETKTIFNPKIAFLIKQTQFLLLDRLYEEVQNFHIWI